MRHTRITLHPARSSAAAKGSDSQAAHRTLARTLFLSANKPIEKGLSDSVWKGCPRFLIQESSSEKNVEKRWGQEVPGPTLPLGRQVAC